MTLFVTRLAELPVGARSFLYALEGLKNDQKLVSTMGSRGHMHRKYFN